MPRSTGECDTGAGAGAHTGDAGDREASVHSPLLVGHADPQAGATVVAQMPFMSRQPRNISYLYSLWHETKNLIFSGAHDLAIVMQIMLEIFETTWESKYAHNSIGAGLSGFCFMVNMPEVYAHLKQIRKHGATYLDKIHLVLQIFAIISFAIAGVAKGSGIAFPDIVRRPPGPTPTPAFSFSSQAATPVPFLDPDFCTPCDIDPFEGKTVFEYFGAMAFAFGMLFKDSTKMTGAGIPYMRHHNQPDIKTEAMIRLKQITHLLGKQIPTHPNLHVASINPNGISLTLMASWVSEHYSPQLNIKHIIHAGEEFLLSSSYLALIIADDEFKIKGSFISQVMRMGISIISLVSFIILIIYGMWEYYKQQLRPAKTLISSLESQLEIMRRNAQHGVVQSGLNGTLPEIQAALELAKAAAKNFHAGHQSSVSVKDLMWMLISRELVENIGSIEEECGRIMQHYGHEPPLGEHPRDLTAAHQAQLAARISAFAPHAGRMPSLAKKFLHTDQALHEITQKHQALAGQLNAARNRERTVLTERDATQRTIEQLELLARTTSQDNQTQIAHTQILLNDARRKYHNIEGELRRHRAQVRSLETHAATMQRDLATKQRSAVAAKNAADAALRLPDGQAMPHTLLAELEEMHQLHHPATHRHTLALILIVFMNGDTNKIAIGLQRLRQIAGEILHEQGGGTIRWNESAMKKLYSFVIHLRPKTH